MKLHLRIKRQIQREELEVGELRQIRLSVILKMLEADERLKRIVKLYL